jgi:hypothetical protein
MSESKYGKYLMPIDVKVMRQGEPPMVSFSAVPYGLDVSWGIIAPTQPVDEETRKRLFENPHKHPHPQFITYFGSNPYNMGEFDAEISVCLGEEREEHIINKPTAIYFPSGLVHAYGQTPHRIGTPVFHLDMNFAPQYTRVNLP